MRTSKKSGLQMLNDMSRKKRAMKPGGNPLTGADLGGFNSRSSFRGGQSVGQGGGPQVGDWPYNGRQDKRKPKMARKNKKKIGKTKYAIKSTNILNGRTNQSPSFRTNLLLSPNNRMPSLRGTPQTGSVMSKHKSKKSKKKYAHKGHTHRSRKAMKSC